MTSGAVTIEGVDYTPQQILDELTKLIAAIDDSAHAYAAWRAQLDRQRTLEETMHGFIDGLGASVRLRHGKDLKVLGDFGLEVPKKPGPKTAAVKAASAKKATATRAERGTMGKRQRKKEKA
jgi:hypothetical protein